MAANRIAKKSLGIFILNPLLLDRIKSLIRCSSRSIPVVALSAGTQGRYHEGGGAKEGVRRQERQVADYHPKHCKARPRGFHMEGPGGGRKSRYVGHVRPVLTEFYRGEGE